MHTIEHQSGLSPIRGPFDRLRKPAISWTTYTTPIAICKSFKCKLHYILCPTVEYCFLLPSYKFRKYTQMSGWCYLLTHWGRVKHICVGKITIIGSDNGLSPARRQAIIWTNAGILLIGPLWTNLSEILIGIQTFPFTKMHLKMSCSKWRPFCLDHNVLMFTFWYETAMANRQRH